MSIVKPKTKDKQFSLNNLVIESILDKKGEDIVLLDMTPVNETITDTFIICDADNTTQVRAISNNIIDMVEKQTGILPYSKEGLENCEWVLLDYIDTVVHIFYRPKRQFYQLEELWHDATLQKIES